MFKFYHILTVVVASHGLLTIMGFTWFISGSGLPRRQIHLPHPGHHPLCYFCAFPDHLWIHILMIMVKLPVLDHLWTKNFKTYQGTIPQCISNAFKNCKCADVYTNIWGEKRGRKKKKASLPSMSTLSSLRFVSSCSALVTVSNVLLSNMFPRVFTTSS